MMSGLVTTENTRIVESRYLNITNSGSGNFLWYATVNYVSGSNANWLRISPTAGINRETIKLDIVPTGLTPGVYEALVNIDAGPVAGRSTTRVTVRVTAGPPLAPLIRTLTNAANRAPGPLVAGSLAAITGDRLTGARTEVFFNSIAGRIISANTAEVLVQVPYEMKDVPNANVTVRTDGVASPSYYAYFVDSAPGIFPQYVLNSDSSINADGSPARAGTLIFIHGTGLPLSGVFTAQVHDRQNLKPEYAGVAPGVIGMQLVTVIVPEDLPTMTSDVRICGGPTGEEQVCSPPHPIRIEAIPEPPPL